MDLQLTNKTALVTGSTAGIGFAIAQSLAREGALVFVNGRTEDRVKSAADRIREMSGLQTIEGVAADVGTAEGVERIVKRIPKLDILVNNAGIFEPRAFEQIDDPDWFRLFEVNVMSGVRLSRHYFPIMKRQNWGRVVFISSESALQIPAEMIHYGMTKTAQLAVSRGLAEMTIGTNVTVNTVLPGPTASEGVVEFVDRLASENKVDRQAFEQEFFRSMRPTSLLKRFETTEEIAEVVTFVCSPLSSAINGAALRADGGVIKAIA